MKSLFNLLLFVIGSLQIPDHTLSGDFGVNLFVIIISRSSYQVMKRPIKQWVFFCSPCLQYRDCLSGASYERYMTFFLSNQIATVI